MDVFVSHSAKDTDPVSRIADALRGMGVSVFQSSDARSYGSSVSWLGSLEQGLAQCKIGLFLVTPNYVDSPWLTFELGWLRGRVIAGAAEVLVFGVGVSLSDLSTPVVQYQVLNIATDLTKALYPTMNRAFAGTHNFGDDAWVEVRAAMAALGAIHSQSVLPTVVSTTIEPRLNTVLSEENESTQLSKIDQSQSGPERADEALNAIRACRGAILQRFVESESHSRTLLVGDLAHRFGSGVVDRTVDKMLDVDELARRGNVLIRGRRYGFSWATSSNPDPWI